MHGLGRFFVLRVFLFVFGLVVVVAGVLMVCSFAGAGLGVLMFTVFDAALLYEVLVGPLLVEEQVDFLTGGRIVSIAVAMKAIVPFALLTAVLMFVANSPAHPPLALLWVAQLALLFGLFLGLYFSVLTSSHITQTERRERGMRASVDGLRSSANQLAIKASRLDVTDDATRDLVSRIDQINEELRYLAPVQDTTARGIEERIASDISVLSHQVDADAITSSGIRDATKTADGTLALIRQRKALLSQ